ncbi:MULTISPECIES: DUF2242 domain-containing protein [unclassified Pseudomonas]|uniref:DUF2242 domain-containing protein n=1 Tax=Pseudomonas TaxID=286 RepID=UPI00083924A0|nr:MULTISPECIES: DUF2242 domain-containing protein [unclassified Pseudomonas]POA50898.1 DUF2242 domain-containing protein [Pseudomonas sp. FW507-12TSA]QIH09704.1 DUF2242 domain-containing protein [Pseudomonas sp. BIOMIG1BAC]
MFRSFHLRSAAGVLLLSAVAGCSSHKTAIYEHESFDDSGTFSRNYAVSETASCEAARRALLSQGYIITSNDPKLVSGHKSFQQTGETHLEISFNIVCAKDGTGGRRSTVFANALQDRYALKKLNNSASLGVGVLGSVSMPIGSTDDSMVKVASETVSSAKFYERYFALLELFLPEETKAATHVEDKPKADLGVPENKPDSQAQPPAKAEPQPAPAPLALPLPAPSTPVTPVAEPEPSMSQPVVPPVQAAPIVPVPASEPTPASDVLAPAPVITPPPASTLPPPSEPIQALPR